MTVTSIILLLSGARLVAYLLSLLLKTVCHRYDYPHFTDVGTETLSVCACVCVAG